MDTIAFSLDSMSTESEKNRCSEAVEQYSSTGRKVAKDERGGFGLHERRMDANYAWKLMEVESRPTRPSRRSVKSRQVKLK